MMDASRFSAAPLGRIRIVYGIQGLRASRLPLVTFCARLRRDPGYLMHAPPARCVRPSFCAVRSGFLCKREERSDRSSLGGDRQLLGIRARGKEFDAAVNLENRSEACDFEYPVHALVHVHYSEVNSPGEALLAQL